MSFRPHLCRLRRAVDVLSGAFYGRGVRLLVGSSFPVTFGSSPPPFFSGRRADQVALLVTFEGQVSVVRFARL